jgi:hypothetical protein
MRNIKNMSLNDWMLDLSISCMFNHISTMELFCPICNGDYKNISSASLRKN